MMTILVDMDGVLGDLITPWIARLNFRYCTDVKPEKIKEWDLRKAFPELSGNQIYEPLHDPGLWDDVKPVPGAQAMLKRLVDDGHNVYVVTSASRNTASIKLTHFLFKHYKFLSDDNVIITRHKELIDGDVLIDDGPHNFGRVRGLNILFDAPHNRSIPAKSLDAVRETSWEGVYYTINKYLKENGGI